MSDTRLRIHTLGGLRVTWGKNEVAHREWNRKRAAALLRHLVEATNFRVPAQRIEAKFWPDSTTDAARSNLRVKVFELRTILSSIAPHGVDARRHPAILLEAGDLSLNSLYEPWVDVEAFQAAGFDALDRADSDGTEEALARIESALSLWTGEYFANDPTDAAGAQGGQYSRLRRDLVLKLVELLGTSPRAERELDACFNDYPWDEQIADAFIMHLSHYGRRSRAYEIFQRHDRAVAERTDLRASRRLAALVGESSAPTSPFRAGLNPLIGRQAELQVSQIAIDELREGRSGVFEVRGARGVGKSRFLEDVAERAQRSGCAPILAKPYRGCTESVIAQQLIASIRRFSTEPDADVLGEDGLGLLLQRLAALSSTHPIVVIVDDADFLEERVLASIRNVLASFGGPYLQVTSQHWSAASSERSAVAVRLRTLDLKECRQVVEGTFSGNVDEALANAVCDLWPGELAVLVASAIHAQSAGAAYREGSLWMMRPEASVGDLLSPSVKATIQRRLDDLDEPDRAVLQAITVAGIRPTNSAIAAMLGTSESSVVESLDRIDHADLVARIGGERIVPKALRLVVSEVMDRGRRRELSERASLLRRSHAGTEVAARRP